MRDRLAQFSPAWRDPEATPTRNADNVAANAVAIAGVIAAEMSALGISSYAAAGNSFGPEDVVLLQRLKQHWYAVAWCRKAEDVRSFRLDRMKSIDMLNYLNKLPN